MEDKDILAKIGPFIYGNYTTKEINNQRQK
jgi:hypothetical protein